MSDAFLRSFYAYEPADPIDGLGTLQSGIGTSSSGGGGRGRCSRRFVMLSAMVVGTVMGYGFVITSWTAANAKKSSSGQPIGFQDDRPAEIVQASDRERSRLAPVTASDERGWSEVSTHGGSEGYSVIMSAPAVAVAADNVESACIESAAPGGIQKKTFKPIRELSDFLEGPGLSDVSAPSGASAPAAAAVCEFHHQKSSNHFPHAMQQLYPCWSWWMANPTKSPVLLWDDDKNTGRTSQFLQGFLTVLRTTFNVTIIKNHTDPAVGLREKGTGGAYSLMSRKDIETLRDGILSSSSSSKLNVSSGVQCGTGENESPMPRVTILDRMGNRRLANIAAVKEAIQAAFRNESSSSSSSDVEIRVDYFEGKTFSEQVESFAGTDILISPHGAQLTGLAFMPKCGTVLEIFPRGYYTPMFASLSSRAGLLDHSHIKLGENVSAEKARTLSDRIEARARDVCPPPTLVADAVSMMRRKWRECRCPS